MKDRFWIPEFGRRPLAEIDRAEILSYLRRRAAGTLRTSVRGKRLSAATVNNDRKHLMVFFNWCEAQEWIPRNPVHHHPPRFSGAGRRRTRYITREEEERLLVACRGKHTYEVSARRNIGGRKGGKVSRRKVTFEKTVELPDWLHPMVLVALRCGFRRGTLIRLRWKHIHLTSASWQIPGELMKRRDDYTAPVPSRVLETLREYRARLRRRHLDLGRDPAERLGPKATIFGLSEKTSVASAFRLACRAAGLELTFHDCRRIFFNRCRESGVPIEVAMRLSDRKSLAVVMQHYREVRQSELEEAVRAIDGGAASVLCQDRAPAHPTLAVSANPE